MAAAPTDWKAQWNLGVWAEHARDFAAARRYYASAQENADDKRLLRPGTRSMPTWTNRLISRAMPRTPLKPGSISALGLPFSDVSTSMDGPANVRKLTQSMLSKCGYEPISLDEVDQVLRDQVPREGS